ncbi:MAG: trypsin-like peptidase domain-containing protein, partial [Verrucomicrobiota bacterium]
LEPLDHRVDGQLGKRILLGTVISVIALLLYGTILSFQPDHYSIFRLLMRKPAAPALQRETAASGPAEEEAFRRARLPKHEVASLFRLNAEVSRVVNHVMPAVVSIEISDVTQEPVVQPAKIRRGTMTVNGVEREVVRVEDWKIVDDLHKEIPGVGSGVLVSEDGKIVTNLHVVLDADNIRVTTHDRKVYEAEMIGADSTTDIAILQIKNRGEADRRPFPVLNFASGGLQSGEMVFAFGNPFGLAESVTSGVVNGTGRRFYSDLANEYIQTDAVINPGNSGGPLTNIFGEVVGINVIAYAGERKERGVQGWQGIGLALPSKKVLQSFEELAVLADRDRPYLGVVFSNLAAERAESMGLEPESGVVVGSVELDSPAREILEAGDVILSFGETPVKSVKEARAAIQKERSGARVRLLYWRKGKEASAKVTLGQITDVNQIAQLPEVLRQESSASELREDLKFVLRELTAGDRRETGMSDDLGGIFLFELDPKSGLKGHLKTYDLIHEINGEAIWTEDQFYQILADLPQDRSSRMVLTRNRRRYYLELRPPSEWRGEVKNPEREG